MSDSSPPLPSLEILLEVMTKEREEHRSHFEALDAKAGIVLAFDGVLIPLALGLGTVARVFSVALNALSAVFALITYWPRGFPALEPDRIRTYLTWPKEDVQLVLHDTYGDMIKQARKLLEYKGRMLKTAALLLFAAVLVLALGTVFKPESGSSHVGSTAASSSPSGQRTCPGGPGGPSVRAAAPATVKG